MGFGGVSETVTGIVKKISGTDLPPDKAVELLVKWQDATSHQSPARRFIAITVTLVWVFFASVWAVSKICGRVFYDVVYVNGEEVLNSLTLLSNEVSRFMVDNINVPFSIVMGFYFTMAVVNSARK